MPDIPPTLIAYLTATPRTRAQVRTHLLARAAVARDEGDNALADTFTAFARPEVLQRIDSDTNDIITPAEFNASVTAGMFTAARAGVIAPPPAPGVAPQLTREQILQNLSQLTTGIRTEILNIHTRGIARALSDPPRLPADLTILLNESTNMIWGLNGSVRALHGLTARAAGGTPVEIARRFAELHRDHLQAQVTSLTTIRTNRGGNIPEELSHELISLRGELAAYNHFLDIPTTETVANIRTNLNTVLGQHQSNPQTPIQTRMENGGFDIGIRGLLSLLPPA